MSQYVKIVNGKVFPIKITKPAAIIGFEKKGIRIIDITDMSLKPTYDWTYDNDGFHLPLEKYAMIENGIVIKIINSNDVDVAWIQEDEKIIKKIEHKNVKVEVGWKYEDGKFIKP